MNRSDYEKYLTTLSKEQILDIKDLADIEFLKRVIWEQAGNFLRKNFKDKQVIKFDGKDLKPNIIAKHFYKELDRAFLENKHHYLKTLKSGEGCVMTKVNKLFNSIFTLAMVQTKIDILAKESHIKFARGISAKNFSKAIEYRRKELEK